MDHSWLIQRVQAQYHLYQVRLLFLPGVARQLFQSHSKFNEERLVLGKDREHLVLKAVLDQAWTGIKDYSDDFFNVNKASTP